MRIQTLEPVRNPPPGPGEPAGRSNLARPLLRGRAEFEPGASPILRLFTGSEAGFENRAHFFSAASTAIRRVLADHARKRRAEKRGGDRGRLPMDEVDVGGPVRSEDVLALDEALERLAAFAPLQARIVEMRFFGGLTTSEQARALDLSESTVERNWRLARAWLRGELGDPDGR
jgi:RNA polymerase sigma-70 factor, ECF subfamily